MPTTDSDGGVTLSANDYALLIEALHLAKELCLDLEARTSSDDVAIEVRLLRLVERLEAIGLGTR